MASQAGLEILASLVKKEEEAMPVYQVPMDLQDNQDYEEPLEFQGHWDQWVLLVLPDRKGYLVFQDLKDHLAHKETLDLKEV
ncbi:hypothetical protein PHYPO_G00001520 [Pangasianodon hypophthalmus]|uniref:Uncharacterized protein n=1 Tax=Pangasianodon hypophthalmus TaxID=310915 RepID=A0A5N5Q5C4_PANHP|nr:hypothetical protein PHYPO_G00001520 [Pangasianodon hypophthalmus]